MPVITKPNQHFNTVLYTGTQTTGRTVTGVGFQPDLVWGKSRNNAQNNTLWNSVVGPTKYLFSNATNAETTNGETLQSFNADGFTLGDAFTNESGYTYVAWNWKAGGAAVTNTSGSITSQVSANPTAGFSIVTYTGNGTQPSTIGHGLGVAPVFVLIKNRSTSQNWQGFFNISAYPVTSGFFLEGLNNTNAMQSGGSLWNSTAPTSTVLTVGNNDSNQSGRNYVLYCFAPVAGYSAFGSYTGNGSTDGPFVYTGFRPRWIMIKQSSSSGEGWYIVDTSRDTYNSMGTILIASDSGGDNTSQYPYIDCLSNGFKLRRTWAGVNGSSATYIYMAFAESPFKYASAR